MQYRTAILIDHFTLIREFPGSMNESTLFLIFINDIHDVITSQRGIYAGDTTTYSCQNSNSYRSY